MFHLSYSSKRDYALCPKKYYWKRIKRVVPLSDVRVPRDFGECVHCGLGCLYTTNNVEDAVQTFHARWAKLGMSVQVDKSVYTPEKGSEIIRAYQREFLGLEEWTDLGGEKLLSIELDGGVNYLVKLDRFGESGGKPAIQEWKVTTAPGFFVSEPNSQIVGYLYARSQELKTDVVKCVLTMVDLKISSVGGIVPSRKKGESGRSIFIRDPIVVSTEMFPVWKRDIMQWAARMQESIEKDIWPKNDPDACGSFGGCEYKMLCSQPPSVEETVLALQYKTKEREESQEDAV